MSTPVGIIKKFVDALTKTTKTGTEAVDEALKVFGINGGYSVFKQKFQSDLNGKSDQDFLEQICGVRLNNKDTGAITGSDAGGSTTKTAESIVPETAAAKELTDAQYNSFTKNGLTVNVTYDTSTAPGKEFNYDSETYLAKQKLVTRALYNWWIPESLDLINQSLGINFTDGRANINEINVVFKSFSNNDTATFTNFSYDMGRASEVTLQINTNLLYNMTANDKNGTLDGQKWNGSDLYSYSIKFTNYLDRLILLSLAEIALKANVPYVDKLPWRIAYGLCEIVGGYDSASTNYSNYTNHLYYTDDATNSYYSNYKSYDSMRLSGYALMRYLAKNYSDGTPDETLPAGLSYNDAKTVLTASTAFTGSKIDFADFVTTVKTVNANALTKAVYIVGNDLANSLKGGSGADTLDGGKGNDTLTGGKGNDVFIVGAGKDVITDYASGDKISLGAAITNASVKGSDVVLTMGGNSLTVKNGKGKTLSLIDTAGKSSTTILGGATNDTLLTVTNSTKSPVTIGSDIKTVDASKRTTAVKITGNSAANSIVGGSGADTLYGGAGNDTLTGGKGDDVFIYSAGNDVITDFASGDKISLGAAISKSSVKGSDVVFTVGKNTLTVKNGKGKTFSLIDSAGKSSTTIIGGSSTSTLLTVTDSTKSPVTIASAVKNVDASTRTTAVKITGNSAANSIVGGSGADSIYGGAGNDVIKGGAGNDKLFGDAGNDTIYGGAGNDTFTGGAGNDVFIYEAGNDVIADFASGDKISLGAAISKSSVKGSDVVFTVGKNTLTVKNGAGKSLSLIDSKGKSSTTIVGGSADVLTLDNSSKSPVTLASGVKTADASTRTKAIKITGNALDNSIIGGSGADTLYGGTGNDSLWGNKGADTFLYFEGEGKDVICGFENSDMLLITGAFSASYDKSKKELSFKVGSTANALTLKDFTATTFNINGFDYGISGSTIKRK